MRASLRWLAATAAGIVVFEGLDLLGSGPSRLAWLPVLSPFLAGVAAAWGAGRGAPGSFVAAAAAVWGRIGVDLGVGALRGAHLTPEAGILLVLAFWVPWTLAALGGGAAVVAVRWGLRVTAAHRG